jgi:hypothetical protein
MLHIMDLTGLSFILARAYRANEQGGLGPPFPQHGGRSPPYDVLPITSLSPRKTQKMQKSF